MHVKTKHREVMDGACYDRFVSAVSFVEII